ncbi:hypothetical protein PG995_006431 [Apiospora arundinis]
MMTPPSLFGPIAARHALARNQFSVCRYIPFPPNDDLVHRSDITDALMRLLPLSTIYSAQPHYYCQKLDPGYLFTVGAQED